MNTLVFVIAILGAATAHDVLLGKSAGKRIYDETFTASPTIWRRTDKVTVNATDGEVISKVVIIDNRPDKNGDVKILDGGEGHKNVTIELKSPTVFRGYDFHVEVYAAPESDYEASDNATEVNVPAVIGTDIEVADNATETDDGAVTLDDAAPLPNPNETQYLPNKTNIPREVAVPENDNTTDAEGSGASDLDSALKSIFTDDIGTQDVKTNLPEVIVNENKTTIVMHVDSEVTTTEDSLTTEADVPTTVKTVQGAFLVPVPYSRQN